MEAFTTFVSSPESQATKAEDGVIDVSLHFPTKVK